MVTIAVFLFSLGAGGSPRCAILAALSAAFISGAAQAINDYYDYDVDSHEREPRHPLIRYRLPKSYALYVAVASYLVGLTFAALLTPAHLVAAVVAAFLTYAYSARMRDRKYIGNAAFLAFLATWAREVMKDLEDLDADIGKKTTLPVIAGKHMSSYFAAYLLILAVFFSVFPGPWGFRIFGKYYYPAVAIADLVFIASALYVIRGHPREAELSCKVGMILAILAFAVGLLP